MFFGVVRPGWNVEGGHDAYDIEGHCFYFSQCGQRCPGVHSWVGMQPAREGDTIGLTLDLERGTMMAFKNDEPLGVMATGLHGEYVWAVEMYRRGDCIRIERGAVTY